MTAGYVDIWSGLARWRVWHLLGTNVLRQRYTRSSLGQYWIILGTAITTTAFGLLWSQLWGRPIAELLPYITVAHICWALVTGPLLDAIGTLQANSFYYVNQKAPLSTTFYANLYRNLLVFMHNLIIIFAIWAIFKITPGWEVLWVIPGLLLNGVIVILLGILIGLVCMRYRDMQQITGNLLQVTYFLTPVMWMPEFLPEHASWIEDYNPFAQMLALLRDPLLGRPLQTEAWIVTGTFAFILAMITPYFLARHGKKTVYWL